MNERLYAAYLGPRPANGPVTCATCGCRLTPAEGTAGAAWRHFQLAPGRDARGCRTACLDELHGRDGTVVAAAGAAIRLS